MVKNHDRLREPNPECFVQLVQAGCVARDRGDEIEASTPSRAHAAAVENPAHEHAMGFGCELLDDVATDLTDELHVIGGPGGIAG